MKASLDVKIDNVPFHHGDPRIQALINKYPDVHSNGTGKLKGIQIKLTLNENATPRFARARTVSYLLRKPVEEELAKLQEEGIISPVVFSEYASSIVPFLKKNGTEYVVISRKP